MKKFLIAILFFLSVIASTAHAANFYISSSGGTVTCNGSSVTSQTPTFFNSFGNWANPKVSGKIGPGDTVYLQGTFSSSTGGATLLTVQNSGSAGNIITITPCAEGVTITNSAYWSGANGALNGGGQNYIVLDGAHIGAINNTGNGSPDNYPNQQSSAGIRSNGSVNFTVKNWNVSNIYVHDSASDHLGHSQDTTCIDLTQTTNNTVTGNVCHDAGDGIVMITNGDTGETGWVVAGNTIYHCNWGILISSNGTDSITGGNVGLVGAPNEVYDAYNWGDSTDSAHANGIHMVTGSTTATITGISVCWNYIHGNFWNFTAFPSNSTATSYIYFDEGTPYDGSQHDNLACNNDLVSELSSYGGPGDGFITDAGTRDKLINNTIVTVRAQSQCIDPGPNATMENNTCSGEFCAITGNSFSFTNIDYNNYYNIGSGGWGSGASCSGTSFASWQMATGWDSHSNISNSQLNSSSSPPYQPTNSSSALGTGLNLFNTPATLNIDYLGVSRPNMGSWFMGAFQFVTSGAPSAPSSVSGSNGGSVGAHTVTVTWNPSLTVGTTYFVFRGTVSGQESGTPLNMSGVGTGCIGPSGGCTYTDSTVIAGQNLFYTVESYNGTVFSAPSNEISTTVPVSAPTGLVISH